MPVPTSTPPIASLDRLPNPISFYEQAIALDETISCNYWELGVAYLLAGREDDSQAAWLTPLMTATASETETLTAELIAVLESAARERVKIPDLDGAWLLRQHLWMLAPDRIDNILRLICLAYAMGTLTSEVLAQWQLDKLLAAESIVNIDESLLEQVLVLLVDIQTELSLTIVTTGLQMMSSRRRETIAQLMTAVLQTFNRQGATLFAVELAETCNDLQPDTLSTLQVLCYVYSGFGRYPEATTAAERYEQLAIGITAQVFASYQLQRIHFTAANWQGMSARMDLHRQLLAEFVRVSPTGLHSGQCQAAVLCSFFLPYAEDNPRVNKPIQNQLAQIYQREIQQLAATAQFTSSTLLKPSGCLRIGYIGSTLKSHSVGWLSRWPIHHHDRESFQVFLYCLNLDRDDEFNHQWFRDKVDVTSYFESSAADVVAQIRADEIDILIDLDCLTYDPTCLVMAQKPAPIQVSWLGWDATGIPAVDYFLADPYVLPDDAQDYYSEQIWRLPQTYLAIDGFEIGTPTLRREDLDLPADAIVYLSSQSGYKRHPDCIKAQMEIIKAVPNSYFLIKGSGDAGTIQNFFGSLAAEVGIGLDRLRFLDRDVDEYTHRANLAIADVVLDTFPYNGATTTLETLWMGIPMVTQVGQQFAARNSYTFMLNAGIEEGIAWSQAEYIEWGIKLGLDRELRNKIHGKLRSGRTTAPVWNGKQFTRDLEQAYRDMWVISQARSQQDLN
jgi:predicted O-linked N-acetylglucosamine transferase (SPINDLY family)